MEECIHIDWNNPFQNDLFNREEFIKSVMNMFSNKNDGVVLAIDSAWGTGKTTFIRLWEAHLYMSSEFETIYFNTWENDDTQDPLVPLLNLLLQKIKQKEPKRFKESNLYKASSKLLSNTAPMMIKLLTHGLIDIGQFESLEDYKELIGDYMSTCGETILDKQDEQLQLKEELMKALEHYQQTIINKKVIIFVDELDRCRPDFAIQVLERIKHFFNLKNYYFVIALDKKQLKHSIGAVYSSEMDTDGYLRRFFDYELTLLAPDVENYMETLIKEKFDNRNLININYFWKVLIQVVLENQFSLRDIDKLFMQLDLILPQLSVYKNSTVSNEYCCGYSNVLIYLLTLKMKDFSAYQTVLNRLYTEQDINNLLRKIAVSVNCFNSVIGVSEEYRDFYDEFNRNFLRLHLLSAIQDISSLASYEIKLGNQKIDVTALWSLANSCELLDALMFSNHLKL